MQENNAIDFYNRIVDGQDRHKTVSLEHSSGRKLEGVELHPVDKQVLASVIERLPEELFNAVEESDDPDEAEEQLEDSGMGTEAVTKETVAAFEDLCAESMMHDDLTNHQIRQIVESLDFEVLFRLGSDIIELSFDNSGDIKDFHEPE